MSPKGSTPKPPVGVSAEHWSWIRDLFKREVFQGDPLKQKRRGAVTAFGSRVNGNFRSDSDLDLYIEIAPPLTGSELASLNEALEESFLPFKVDLIESARVSDDILQAIQALPRIELIRQ
jgi:predicted nucleotidyltransferase